MFAPIIVNHPASFTLDTSHIDEIFQLISSSVDRDEQGIVNIAFLSDSEIQSLNCKHRGIDSTTDVLSFHYFDDFSLVSRDDIAGELVFSESKIISQAKEH
jgi:ssRNA-specific RNase YbeY (16S rRNA maturation enzyme)